MLNTAALFPLRKYDDGSKLKQIGKIQQQHAIVIACHKNYCIQSKTCAQSHVSIGNHYEFISYFDVDMWPSGFVILFCLIGSNIVALLSYTGPVPR